ncbi:uncharacterized protein LOC114576554 [Exaiptasia diaphana]|uniref:Uncharacterized protein n=1 Tax=Exaiptasia diaphana TaxID=2652724 RepID=A0A913YVV3_EXADI|nr:uncharacterized protein LOC114576554 [Exaiptasia diaphana]
MNGYEWTNRKDGPVERYPSDILNAKLLSYSLSTNCTDQEHYRELSTKLGWDLSTSQQHAYVSKICGAVPDMCVRGCCGRVDCNKVQNEALEEDKKEEFSDPCDMFRR